MRKYIKIARIDHWNKNLFMLPGAALAAAYSLKRTGDIQSSILAIACAFVGLCLVSSANYTINEWLDRHEDKLHPWKNHRTAVSEHMKPTIVWLQWLTLGSVGMWFSAIQGPSTAMFALSLLGMGLVYNVKPFRTKDIAYLDVISEAVNNPIRMAIGWSCVELHHPVPASAFVAFWGGGIFLMALKRWTEMSLTEDQALMVQYRKSFAAWTPLKLLMLAFGGALVSCSFLGILLAGYRLEYILLLPLVIGLFQHYLGLALNLDSIAIKPEALWKKKSLNLWVGATVVASIALSFIDIPELHALAGF